MLFIWSMVYALPVLCQAQPLYVSGYREVMLRTGPGPQNTLIATLKTGDEMTFIREEGEYYLVSLPDGRRGYVLKTHLTEEVPAKSRLKELEERVTQQAQEIARLRQGKVRLSAEANTQASRGEMTPTGLRQPHGGSGVFQQDNRLFWFLAGPGVFLLGWLFGWTRLRLWRKTQRQGLTLR